MTRCRGAAGVVLDLLPQPADVHVDQPFVAELVAPHPLQQLLAGQHPAGVLGQLAEQPELGAGHRHRLAAQPHLAGLRADLQIAEAQHRRPRRAAAVRARRRSARSRAASSLTATGLTT